MPGLDLIPGAGGGLDLETVQSLIAAAVPPPALPDPPVVSGEHFTQGYKPASVAIAPTAGELILFAGESTYGLNFTEPGYTALASGLTNAAGNVSPDHYAIASKVATGTETAVGFDAVDYTAAEVLRFKGFAPSATVIENVEGNTSSAQGNFAFPFALFVVFGDAQISTPNGLQVVGAQRVWSNARVVILGCPVDGALASYTFPNALRVVTLGLTQDSTDKPSRVPKGGVAGQHLVKLSDADYDTGWVTA